MTLNEYLDGKPRGEMARLQRATGMGYATIWCLAKQGKRLKRYETAKRLSEATAGAVSIADLCDPVVTELPTKKKARRRAA